MLHKRVKFIGLLIFAFNISAIPTLAHKLNMSYTTILISSERFYLIEGFDLAQIAQHLSLDKNNDDVLTRAELNQGLKLIYKYVEDNLEIMLDGIPIKMVRREEKFERRELESLIPKEGFMLKGETHEVIKLTWNRLTYGGEKELSLNVLYFKDFGKDHRNFVRFMGVGESIIAIISAEEPKSQFAIKK